jgi:hypothetical protein
MSRGSRTFVCRSAGWAAYVPKPIPFGGRYVEIAVRVGTAPPARKRQLRDRIQKNAPKIYRDARTPPAWQDLLLRLARKDNPTPDWQ